jgi:hypothetical protein
MTSFVTKGARGTAYGFRGYSALRASSPSHPSEPRPRLWGPQDRRLRRLGHQGERPPNTRPGRLKPWPDLSLACRSPILPVEKAKYFQDLCAWRAGSNPVRPAISPYKIKHLEAPFLGCAKSAPKLRPPGQQSDTPPLPQRLNYRAVCKTCIHLCRTRIFVSAGSLNHIKRHPGSSKRCCCRV